MHSIRTVSDMVVALSALPPSMMLVLDLGDSNGFIQAAVEVDDEGARIILDPADFESQQAQKFIVEAQKLVDTMTAEVRVLLARKKT